MNYLKINEHFIVPLVYSRSPVKGYLLFDLDLYEIIYEKKSVFKILKYTRRGFCKITKSKKNPYKIWFTLINQVLTSSTGRILKVYIEHNRNFEALLRKNDILNPLKLKMIQYYSNLANEISKNK